MHNRTRSRLPNPKLTRRQALLLGSGGAAAAVIRSRSGRTEEVEPDTISVLAPLLPDPAPPGVLDYLAPNLELWETSQNAKVKYDPTAVEMMKAKILINLRQNWHNHDVMYCAGWAQEIAGSLLPIDSMLTPGVRAELPTWSLNSYRWNGKTYGVPSAANPMILFANQSVLSEAGITSLPTTWDELVDAAEATTSADTVGWTLPAGQIGGLGGLMSHWLIFFLQAGGDLFDRDGKPQFATDAGVAALEMLIRLLPFTDPATFEHKSLIDATAAFMKGKTAMMMNWAIMHRSLSNSDISIVARHLTTAVLPSGPIGTASIDSGDGWTIDSRTWIPDKSMALIQFFLQPRVQKQMLTNTGWLPISISALEDDVVQAMAPHAAAVRQQLKSRIESGFRPNFDVVTRIIGQEVSDALRGVQTPIVALRSARDQINAAAASRFATT